MEVLRRAALRSDEGKQTGPEIRLALKALRFVGIPNDATGAPACPGVLLLSQLAPDGDVECMGWIRINLTSPSANRQCKFNDTEWVAALIARYRRSNRQDRARSDVHRS